MFNQENLLFLKREIHHHKSFCRQNVNNYFVSFNKFKIFDFESRLDSLVKSKLQSIQNTGNNEPLSEEAETLYCSTQVKLVNIIKILNELHQTKSDLEDSKEKKVILKLKFSKREAELEILQTYVSRSTTTIYQ